MNTARHTSRRIATALAVLTAVASPAAAPAQAAGGTSAVCTEQFVATITPGFTIAPTSGTQTTHGETGTIVCVGTIAGHRVTGPGSMGYDMAHEGASCLSERASGTVSVTIPTTAGRMHLVGALSVQRTLLAIRVTVQFPGMRYVGAGVASPVAGVCPLTPMRRASVVLTGTLSDS